MNAQQLSSITDMLKSFLISEKGLTSHHNPHAKQKGMFSIVVVDSNIGKHKIYIPIQSKIIFHALKSKFPAWDIHVNKKGKKEIFMTPDKETVLSLISTPQVEVPLMEEEALNSDPYHFAEQAVDNIITALTTGFKIKVSSSSRQPNSAEKDYYFNTGSHAELVAKALTSKGISLDYLDTLMVVSLAIPAELYETEQLVSLAKDIKHVLQDNRNRLVFIITKNIKFSGCKKINGISSDNKVRVDFATKQQAIECAGILSKEYGFASDIRELGLDNFLMVDLINILPVEQKLESSEKTEVVDQSTVVTQSLEDEVKTSYSILQLKAEKIHQLIKASGVRAFLQSIDTKNPWVKGARIIPARKTALTIDIPAIEKILTQNSIAFTPSVFGAKAVRVEDFSSIPLSQEEVIEMTKSLNEKAGKRVPTQNTEVSPTHNTSDIPVGSELYSLQRQVIRQELANKALTATVKIVPNKENFVYVAVSNIKEKTRIKNFLQKITGTVPVVASDHGSGQFKFTVCLDGVQVSNPVPKKAVQVISSTFRRKDASIRHITQVVPMSEGDMSPLKKLSEVLKTLPENKKPLVDTLLLLLSDVLPASKSEDEFDKFYSDIALKLSSNTYVISKKTKTLEIKFPHPGINVDLNSMNVTIHFDKLFDKQSVLLKVFDVLKLIK